VELAVTRLDGRRVDRLLLRRADAAAVPAGKANGASGANGKANGTNGKANGAAGKANGAAS
jgi:hypothetical protein